MSQDYIDAAIAAFAASQGTDQDGLAPEERAKLHAEKQAKLAANQKLEMSRLVTRKIEAGVRIVNDRSVGHNIPLIALCGTGFNTEAGVSIPNFHDIQFSEKGGIPLSYQPLGYVAFKFEVDGAVEATSRGPVPHHPHNTPPEFVFGVEKTASMSSEWVADMIARWLFREHMK